MSSASTKLTTTMSQLARKLSALYAPNSRRRLPLVLVLIVFPSGQSNTWIIRKNVLFLHLGLKPKRLSKLYLSVTTSTPFTLTVLHNVPMEVRFHWVMLDLPGRLGLAWKAAGGVELARLPPLRQSDVVECRNMSRANNKTPLRHVREGILLLLFDGVLSVGTRRVVPLREHRVLVGGKNRRAVVTDTVKAVYKLGCQRLVKEPRYTTERVALRLASIVETKPPEEALQNAVPMTTRREPGSPTPAVSQSRQCNRSNTGSSERRVLAGRCQRSGGGSRRRLTPCALSFCQPSPRTCAPFFLPPVLPPAFSAARLSAAFFRFRSEV